MRVPAALLAIPLLTGSAAGLLLYDTLPASALVPAFGSAALSWIAALGATADDDGWMCAACVAAAALLAGVTLGLDAARRAYAPPLRAWFESSRAGATVVPVVVEGTLREDAAQGAFGVALLVDVESVRRADPPGSPVATAGGVRLSVAGSLAPLRIGAWRAGRRIRAAAVLREPTTYANPGRSDDRRALARRGVVLVGSIKSAALVEITAPAGALTEAAGRCRAWARRRLAALVGQWSARSGAIASAILVGDRTGLSPDDERRLQEAGTYHVVAISGGNIAMLTLLLMAAGRAMRAPPRLAAGAAILLLLFYGRVAGAAPSVDRAITAAVGYLAGRLLDQRGAPVNVLAVAAILAAALAPVAIFDPGFLLSFGATLGILTLVPRLASSALRWLRTASGVAERPSTDRSCRKLATILTLLVGLLMATAAAEIALAPIGAALFFRVTFAGLFLNVAAIPLMAIVQASSIAALGFGAITPALGGSAGYAAHAAAEGLVESSRLLEVAPWLSLEVPAPSWWLVAAYYGFVVAGVIWRRALPYAAAAAAAIGTVILAGPAATSRDAPPPPRPGWLRVVFLDVGQGDATLARLPDGRAFLVDAGGVPAGAPLDSVTDGPAFDVGDRVVAPALRTLGVRRLDTFVLTHADPDHVGGAMAVLRRFRPRAVWEGVPVPPSRPLAQLALAGDAAGAEWRSVQAGERVRYGAVVVRVLHPPRPDWERQRVRNEDSVVLDIRIGGVSVVLPGDIGREAERAIVQAIDPSPVTILKAAHHGSATSSTPPLLETLQPRVAIFSAGRGNRFGHPAPAVVSRFRAAGSTLFSTAEDGAVFVDTDGEVAEVWGWKGRTATFRAARASSRDPTPPPSPRAWRRAPIGLAPPGAARALRSAR